MMNMRPCIFFSCWFWGN